MEETRLQKTASIVAGLAILFCGFESVPGWGIFQLGWPPVVYFSIMGVAGAFLGIALGKYRTLGAFSGVLGGILALAAVKLLLANVKTVHSTILVLVAFMGALPGIGLYWLGAAILDRVAIPRDLEADLAQANPWQQTELPRRD